MRTVVLLGLLAACGHDAPAQRQVALGSSDPWGSPARGSGAARDGAVGSGAIAPPLSADERHARAQRLCATVTPYFYELAKDGKVSHILGTRHVGVAFAMLPQVVHDDLHAAKLAVFEFAPDDKSQFTAPDEPLRDELGEADWRHFEELVGLPTADLLERGTAAAAVISMAVEPEDLTAILDKEIQDDVATAHIPARGLETAEFQDHVLARLLDLRLLKATIETTKSRADMEADAAKDLREYCAGTNTKPGTDDETRAKLKKAGYSDAEIDAQDDTLVFSRNRDWIPKLEELFAQGDVFVAVGADHLIGAKGVIALLQRHGFTAKRITQ